MTNVIALEKKFKRRKVISDPPVNADTILLRMYKEHIDKIFCMDCITTCDLPYAACREPVQMRRFTSEGVLLNIRQGIEGRTKT
jgi:hypothetical protein